MKSLLPRILGPEHLMPFFFIAFYLGQNLASESALPRSWVLFSMFLTMGIIVQKKKRFQPMIFLTAVALLHVILGIIAHVPNPIIPKNPNHVFLIREIKVGKNNRIKAIADLHCLYKHTLVSCSEKTLCYFDTTMGIHRGDLIFTIQPIKKIINSQNPGSFDMENYYSTKGIHTQCTVGKHFLAIGHSTCWDDWMVRLRASLNTSFERRLSGEALGLAKALLLGNTADVNEKIKKSFSATGAIHVLAVSGMHISLFAALILYSFRYLLMGIRRAWAILIALIILWSYASLTGFSPSVIRAVTMFTLVNLGQLTQRKGNANYNLFWCGFLMYLFDPMCIFDIGFQLSFSAVYGIQTYKDRITSWWNPKSKLLRLMWEHSSIAIAAQLFTVPLILYYFHSFPNYFLIANLGIVVLSGLAMYLGFGFLLLGWIPLIGHVLGFLFSCALQLMNWFIFSIASLPGAVEGGFSFSHWALICLFILLFAILHSKLAIWQKCIAGLLILSGLSYNRYIHQMETHLMILQAKRPILIYKRKTHITLFYSPYETKNSLQRVLADYQKIYPCKSIVTHKLPNQTTINLKNAEILFGTKQLTINGNTTYRIYFQSNGNWYLHDTNHVKKIEAGCKLAF